MSPKGLRTLSDLCLNMISSVSEAVTLFNLTHLFNIMCYDVSQSESSTLFKVMFYDVSKSESSTLFNIMFYDVSKSESSTLFKVMCMMSAKVSRLPCLM